MRRTFTFKSDLFVGNSFLVTMDPPSTSSVIFEIWLYVICEDKPTSKIGFSLWRNKYFVLMRHFAKPEVRLYSKKPSHFGKKADKISIEDGYQVTRKSFYKGRSPVCLLSTGDKKIYLAPQENHICDFVCFFLRTLSKLRGGVEGVRSFVVRPEKSRDTERLACFDSVCLLNVSEHGITLSLQLSGNVVGQWPLRCIRTYECSGQGRFVFDFGPISPTGTTRLALRTKLGQDAAMFDLLERLIEETARSESIAFDHMNIDQSRESSSEREYSKELIGLSRIVEISTDQSFDQHLKKLSREIYDHLGEHFGDRSADAQTCFESSRRSAPSTVLSFGSGSPVDGYLTPLVAAIPDSVFPSNDSERGVATVRPFQEAEQSTVKGNYCNVFGGDSPGQAASRSSDLSYLAMNKSKKNEDIPLVAMDSCYLTPSPPPPPSSKIRHYSVERGTTSIQATEHADKKVAGRHEGADLYLNIFPRGGRLETPRNVQDRKNDDDSDEGGDRNKVRLSSGTSLHLAEEETSMELNCSDTSTCTPQPNYELDQRIYVGDETYLSNLNLRKLPAVPKKVFVSEIVKAGRKEGGALSLLNTS